MSNLKLGIVIGATVSNSYKSVLQSTDKNIRQLGDSIAKTNTRFKAVGDVIKYKNTLTLLKDKQVKLGGSSIKLSAGIKEVELRYRQAKREAKAYGISIGKVIGEHKRLGNSLATLERRQKRFTGMAKAKEGMGALRGKFLGLIGAAYGASRIGGQAITHEQATIRLSTLAVFDKASLTKATDFARDYAQKNITDETTMVDIQYQLGSAGLGAQASMMGAEIVAKVAKVTRGSAAGVGKVIGQVFNNMSDSLEGNTKQKLERIGDLLTKTQLKFTFDDFGQVGESMAKASKGAILYHVPLDQMVTILGRLNSSSVEGSLSGTTFNAILRQMGKAAEELGFEIERDAQGNMDMIKTIENLNEAMSDTTDIDERAAILQEAFGDEGLSVVMLLDNLEELKSAYKDVKDTSKGVVDKGYAKFMKSTGGQMAIFGNNIKMIGTAFSESLFPAINLVLTPISDFAKFVTNGIRDFPVIGQVIGGIAVGVGLYAAGLGIATAAQWAMNAAMLANPIGLAVAGLVVGATLIYKYWGGIKDKFIGIWNGIKNIFGQGVAYVFKVIKGITSVIPDSFLPESMSAKNLGATIKKYQNLGKVVKEQAKAFEAPKNIKQKIAQAVAVTALATNIAAAQTPKIIQQTTTTITTPITTSITVQESANPRQTAEEINTHLKKLQQPDYQFDIDEI